MTLLILHACVLLLILLCAALCHAVCLWSCTRISLLQPSCNAQTSRASLNCAIHKCRTCEHIPCVEVKAGCMERGSTLAPTQQRSILSYEVTGRIVIIMVMVFILYDGPPQRLGRCCPDTTRSRPVRLKFGTMHGKHLFLKHAKVLRQANFKVDDDLTPLQQQDRRILRRGC